MENNLEEFLVNKELVEVILKKKVKSIQVKIGTNPGDNFMSIIHAVEVESESDDKPMHILIKCYPNHPMRRGFLDQSDVFRREFFFYNDWTPLLLQLANKTGTKEKIHLAIPEYLGGNYKGSKPQDITCPEPWSKENFIIMSDLRKAGFKMTDRMKGLNVQHTKLVLKDLATLHALSWCYKTKNNISRLNEIYPVLIDNLNSPEFEKFVKPLLDSVMKSSEKLIEDSLGSDSPIFQGAKKLFAVDKSICDFLRRFLSPNGIDEKYTESILRVPPKTPLVDDEPWMVGCHGDCWVNNFLFQYDSHNQPIKTILLDLQLYKESCPTTDLAYFFYSSTTLSIRKPNEEAFLKLYYDEFMRVCNALKCEPMRGFSFEALQRRFRRSKTYGLFMALPLLSIVLKPPQESANLDSKERAGNLGSSLEGSEKNQSFKNRILEIVTDFYEEGIL